jgi:hypothetical protein
MAILPTQQIDPGPASGAFAVTPSDSANLAQASRGLWIGGAGNVNVYMSAEANRNTPTAVLFSGIPAGTLLPISVYRVLSASTTATLIVALV